MMHRRLVWGLLAAQAAAVWPVWRWVWARVGDGSGDGAALAACALALLVRPAEAGAATERPSLGGAIALTLAYAASAAFGPPLLSAGLAFAMLLVSWSAARWSRHPHPAAFGLVVLALPAIPTAQFLLGYPLRVATGTLAARLLQGGGFAVERQGTALRLGARVVAVDAPCSGVHLLWAALLLALALALAGRLSAGRTATLALAAAALALAGNAVRGAALALAEIDALHLPAGGHEGVGLVTFALAAVPLLPLFRWMRRSAPSRGPQAAHGERDGQGAGALRPEAA